MFPGISKMHWKHSIHCKWTDVSVLYAWLSVIGTSWCSQSGLSSFLPVLGPFEKRSAFKALLLSCLSIKVLIMKSNHVPLSQPICNFYGRCFVTYAQSMTVAIYMLRLLHIIYFHGVLLRFVWPGLNIFSLQILLFFLFYFEERKNIYLTLIFPGLTWLIFPWLNFFLTINIFFSFLFKNNFLSWFFQDLM